MKKFLAFMILAVGFFTCGCQQAHPDAAKKPAGSSAYTEKHVKNTADWPTKAWRISTPGQQGIDENKLARADKRIREDYPNIYSLLVVRHGYLCYEKYYNGMNSKSANPVYSVTKSVISAMTGIAIRQNLIKNVDQKIEDFLPQYFTNVDNKQKKDITINNVLTMTGGLHSVDYDFGSYYSSSDWMDYAVKQPLTEKPGSKFQYNTGLTHFLSVLITKASGMDSKTFADKYLFSKIGITENYWMHDQKGYFGGGFGLYLTPRDMAKFGYLYLNKGKWNEEQVVPEDWVEKSTQKHVTADKNEDYGYLFWIETMRDPQSGRSYFTYRADGAGGQKIIVIPELSMVAVITADASRATNDSQQTQKIVADYVIPAVNR